MSNPLPPLSPLPRPAPRQPTWADQAHALLDEPGPFRLRLDLTGRSRRELIGRVQQQLVLLSRGRAGDFMLTRLSGNAETRPKLKRGGKRK